MEILAKAQQTAKHIRLIRLFRNYSQDYMALKLGMSQNGYSKIENGLSSIRLERLFDIAEALEVDIQDLFVLNLDLLKKTELKKLSA